MDTRGESLSHIPAEVTLRVSTSSLSEVFNNGKFPQEFAPEHDWNKRIEIQKSDVFDSEFLKEAAYITHSAAVISLESTRAVSIADARVSREDPHIIVRERSIVGRDPNEVSLLLSHEIGHLKAGIKREPYRGEDSEDFINQLKSEGYEVGVPQLSIVRWGPMRQIEVDGRILGGIYEDEFVDLSNDFMNEIYADIYRMFTFSHFISHFGKKPFKAAIAEMKALGKDVRNSKSGQYFNNLIQYSADIGWEKLLEAGISSDEEKFLDQGRLVLGKEANVKALRKLESLRQGMLYG